MKPLYTKWRESQALFGYFQSYFLARISATEKMTDTTRAPTIRIKVLSKAYLPLIIEDKVLSVKSGIIEAAAPNWDPIAYGLLDGFCDIE